MIGYMKKIFSNSITRAIVSTLLVVAMCAIQYESGISDSKYWIASIIIVCVMLYLITLIAGLVKKNKAYEKELTDYKNKLTEVESQNNSIGS